MPDKRSHRGPHPEDRELFGPAALPALCEAAGELCWLLDRGYPTSATLSLVGDRHRLTRRQRVALGRCACSCGELALRRKRRLDPEKIAGGPLLLDGYNVLTTVEAALGGGVILAGRDGCYRDMASMHGTYRKVAETIPALERIGRMLQSLRVQKCRWLLDSPVSNSGRLKTMMGRLAEQHGWPWEIELVRDPDGELARSALPVATADSGILDRCGPWLDLARIVLRQHVPEARVVRLLREEASGEGIPG